MKEIKKPVGFYTQKRSKWKDKVTKGGEEEMKDNPIVERPVVMVFNYHGESLHMLTGIRVAECNWIAKKKQRVKPGVKRATEINQILDNLAEKVNDIYWKGISEGVTITNAYLLDRLKNRLKAPEQKTFWQHFDDYLETLEGVRADGTYDYMCTTYRFFKEFCQAKKLDIKFEDINPKLLLDYQKYLLEKTENVNNTIAGKIKRLKRFLNYAFKLGLHQNLSYKSFIIKESVGPKKYLEIEEVRQLMNVHLDSILEQKSRDVLLMCTYTGLRHSDIENLKVADIKKHRFDNLDGDYLALHVKTKKDSDNLIVPLLPEALVILKKYENQGEYALPKLKLQVVNEVLKNVGRKAGLNEMQKIEKERGNKRETTYVEKWRTLTTHFGRRTFVTIAATKGIPINIVSSITGQHPSTIIKHYMGVLGEEKVRIMMEKMKF